MAHPYHPGEIAVQELAGERDQAILNSRMLWSAIPSSARSFIGQQASVAVGWLDAAGHACASLTGGPPGFATCSDDGTVVSIRLSSAWASARTAHGSPHDASAVGMLFIDLATRRRLRVNGVVAHATDDTLRILVEQAFPNCPKYIHRREVCALPERRPTTVPSGGLGLPADVGPWLSRVDTAFVASVGPDARVDCSHRGGQPGFIRQEGDTLLMPDYPGNSMFCTLGNISVDPRTALVLIDFDEGQQLHLSGDAAVELAGAARPDATGGTDRWLRLRVRKWAASSFADSISWQLTEMSRFAPSAER